MKHFYISVTFLILIQNIFAQDTIQINFDRDWKKVENGENVVYYRKLFKTGKLWYAKDYYLNGKLQMEGSFRNKKCTKNHGEFIYYFENGNVDRKGKYFKNKYEGIWCWYHLNGNKSSEELYSKGKRIKVEYWDSNGIKVDSADGEHKARFNGSEQGFREYVGANLKYPSSDEKAGIEGRVFIGFVIEIDGSLTYAHVIRSAEYELDKEALRVIQSSPKWEPAKLHNRLVRIDYVFPVTFILK